jgi:hypothetical protein
MKIAYTLKRKNDITEVLQSDTRIIEQIQKTANKKYRSKYVEQNLGTFPIAVKDFLYQTLKI